MNRQEAMRQARQAETLLALGFTANEAESLRRISMTLQRWHELECGTDSGCVERGYRLARNMEKPRGPDNPSFTHDDNAPPYWVDHSGNWPRYRRIPDREKGAKRRLAGILQDRNARMLPLQSPDKLTAYIQTDPRGAALYILRPGDVPAGADASAYYMRGICVY